MRYTRKRKQRGGNIDELKKSIAALNASIANAEMNPVKNKGLIIKLKQTKKGVLKAAIIKKQLARARSGTRSARSASRVPPPPPRNSASRRSAPRQSKSLFSCLPGMSCSNAKGIRKKRRRRRRTRRKR